MPVVAVNVVRYKAKCDSCSTERPYEADTTTGALVCAESVGGWTWTVKDNVVTCKCPDCQRKKPDAK